MKKISIAVVLKQLLIIFILIGKIKSASPESVSIKLGKPLLLSCQAEDPNETKDIEW
jgi:hypothetical protein